MQELQRKDYKLVLSLTEHIKHNKALIHSLIEGNSTGKIIVDNVENPKAAYIENEFSYLVGCEDNIEFNNNICDYIIEKMMEDSTDRELILFFSSGTWKDIDSKLKAKGCINIERKMFSFNEPKFKKLQKRTFELPERFHIQKINSKIVDTHNKYHDILAFPSRFGFCIVHEEDTVSQCTSVAVGAGEAEIDISTNEKYRQNGYATRVAIAFINHCLENNMTPVWSCWPFRSESIMLAAKLGFEESENIPALYWSRNM